MGWPLGLKKGDDHRNLAASTWGQRAQTMHQSLFCFVFLCFGFHFQQPLAQKSSRFFKKFFQGSVIVCVFTLPENSLGQQGQQSPCVL